MAKRSRSSPLTRFSIMALLSTAAVFVMLLTLWSAGLYVVWVVALSITTLAFYIYDKSQSRRNGSRVPELVLHGMALTGGFLGGWLGMLALPHKVRKPAFWAVLVGSTLLHALIFHSR